MMRHLIAALAVVLALPAAAQTPPAAPAPARPPRTILFVGNSFTQGAHSAVARYGIDRVTDLTGQGYGGVPAIFATLARQAGQDWAVSSETQGGKTLAFHYDERRALIDRRWDAVVLQELSTLDRARPGDATGYRAAAPLLTGLVRARNPAAQVWLMATWSRADLVWRAGSPWSGRGIYEMARALRGAADALCRERPIFNGVLPVGDAWNRAFAEGVADPNPYDGIAFGQVDLWTYDQYHASIAGYYLEALVVFGRIAGVDPTNFGADEQAGRDLGLSAALIVRLQQVARAEIAQPDGCAARFRPPASRRP